MITLTDKLGRKNDFGGRWWAHPLDTAYRERHYKFRPTASGLAWQWQWCGDTGFTINDKEELAMRSSFTEEETRERFDMAEAHQDTLEQRLMEVCPGEIVDQFRAGDKRELFRVLLIAPGMELEEGIYCVQSAPEVDEALGLAPCELVLECGGSVQGEYRVRLRTEAPSEERLVEDHPHYTTEPQSWGEVEVWARSLRAMNIGHQWDD